MCYNFVNIERRNVMLKTTKQKIFCFGSIIAYILSIVFASITFAGVSSSFKIKTDGAGMLFICLIVALVLYALWVVSFGDISSVIIAFIGSVVGLAATCIFYWRCALLSKAADVMNYHSYEQYLGYSSSQRGAFSSISDNFGSNSTVFLVLTIISALATIVAIVWTLNNIKQK